MITKFIASKDCLDSLSLQGKKVKQCIVSRSEGSFVYGASLNKNNREICVIEEKILRSINTTVYLH